MNTKHGMYGAPEYWVWNQMKQRCMNRRLKTYKNYGGRGVRVCSRWNQFANFIEDMGRRPSDRHTLERKDNNKGYAPDNCYWADRTTQGRNTRRVKLTISLARNIRKAYANGETQRSIAKRFGISHGYVSQIVTKQFWKEG